MSKSPQPDELSHHAAGASRADSVPRPGDSCSGSPAVELGHAGDHLLVLKFLSQIKQKAIDEDFQSRLDQPSYRPSDRLLIRRNNNVAGHVQLCSHVAWYRGQRIPAVALTDFAVLPEYQNGAFESALLGAAENTARQEGAAVALMRTTQQRWFSAQGWTRLCGQGYTRANPRHILASVDVPRSDMRRRSRDSVEVRSWRHYELDAIRDIYEQAASQMWGALRRSEAWWQWLVGRKAGEQILMAVLRGPNNGHPQAAPSALTTMPADSAGKPAARAVGYAVVRDSRIIEMFTLPGWEVVRSHLLARACRDAIDRGHHAVSLLTSADDPLHEVLVTAEGQWIRHDATRDGVWMFKLLSAEKWIAKMYPVLHDRAHAASVARPVHIDFVADGENYQFTLTRRSARMEELATQDGAIDCTREELQSLLASNLRQPANAVGASRKQTRAIDGLFPLELFWRSPFEYLRL